MKLTGRHWTIGWLLWAESFFNFLRALLNATPNSTSPVLNFIIYFFVHFISDLITVIDGLRFYLIRVHRQIVNLLNNNKN